MRLEKLGIDEKRSAALKEIAKAAAKVTQTPTEIILEGIRNVPNQLQMMVDSIVAMQEDFPMPEEGWQAFVRDIEYTNKKHGLNLKIRRADDQT